MVADILLVGGALGAGLYCFVLARRLNRFNDLETGVGGAVAVLSAQVDDLTRTLNAAQSTAGNSSETLVALTQRAEGVAQRLELLVAAMHDLPDPGPGRADPVDRPDPSPHTGAANQPGSPPPAPAAGSQQETAALGQSADAPPAPPVFMRRKGG
jgi:hypothetical protein